MVRGVGQRWNSCLFQGFQHLMQGQPFVHTAKQLLSNPSGSNCSLMHSAMSPVTPGWDEHPFHAVSPGRGCPTPCSFQPGGDKRHEDVFEEDLGMWREGGEAN